MIRPTPERLKDYLQTMRVKMTAFYNIPAVQERTALEVRATIVLRILEDMQVILNSPEPKK